MLKINRIGKLIFILVCLGINEIFKISWKLIDVVFIRYLFVLVVGD